MIRVDAYRAALRRKFDMPGAVYAADAVFRFFREICPDRRKPVQRVVLDAAGNAVRNTHYDTPENGRTHNPQFNVIRIT